MAERGNRNLQQRLMPYAAWVLLSHVENEWCRGERSDVLLKKIVNAYKPRKMQPAAGGVAAKNLMLGLTSCWCVTLCCTCLVKTFLWPLETRWGRRRGGVSSVVCIIRGLLNFPRTEWVEIWLAWEKDARGYPVEGRSIHLKRLEDWEPMPTVNSIRPISLPRRIF